MAKYKFSSTSVFDRQYKKMKKRGYDLSLLQQVIEMLQDGTTLPAKYKDHALTGNWKDHRECHITPDWLLIYRMIEDRLMLVAVRTGTHSDLFNK